MILKRFQGRQGQALGSPRFSSIAGVRAFVQSFEGLRLDNMRISGQSLKKRKEPLLIINSALEFLRKEWKGTQYRNIREDCGY